MGLNYTLKTLACIKDSTELQLLKENLRGIIIAFTLTE